MKKIDTKKIVFVISLVLITGFSTYALANRGFGSHMGGNNGNGYSGYHMGSGNGYGMGANQHMYNGNHMYDSVQMGAEMYNDGHMGKSQHMYNGNTRNYNHMYDDRNNLNNNFMQNYSNNNSEYTKDDNR
jgi:hypothetical protein